MKSSEKPKDVESTSTTVKGVGGIGGSMIVSAVLSYLLLKILAIYFTPNEYARFLTIWGVIFGVGAALSVIEQEVSRRAAHDDLAQCKTGRDLLRVSLVALGVVLAVHVLIVTTPLAVRLYGTSNTWAMALLVFISSLGFAAQLATRGLLIGHRSTTSYSILVLTESIIRLVVVGALILASSGLSLTGAIFAVATGSFAWLVVFPSTRRLCSKQPASQSWGRTVRTVATLGAGTSASAALLTGFTSLATMIIGSSDDLAPVFTAITATRIPLILIAPIQAAAIPFVIRKVEKGGRSALTPMMLMSVPVVTLITVVGAAVGWLIGPWIVQILFSAKYDPPAWSVGLIAASTVLVGVGQLLGAVLVAFNKYLVVAGAWGGAVLGAIVVLALIQVSGTASVTISLVVSSVIVVIISAVGVWLSVRSPIATTAS